MTRLDRLARPFVLFVERCYPDAFVFALLLTALTFLLAMTLADVPAPEAVDIWGRGLTGLLAFMAQIALTLILAHALAHTDAVRALLQGLGRLPRRPAQAYFLVAVVAGVGSLVAWSLGLVVGALIAMDVAARARERGLAVHFPLLVASAYSGFVVWHMGYSSSSALFVATPGHSLEAAMGLLPVTETILAPWNLALAAVTVLAVALLCGALHPRQGLHLWQGQPPADDTDDTDHGQGADGPGFGRWLESRRALSLLFGLLVLTFLARWFAAEGLALTLDIVNWSFLGLGLVLARSPIHYVRLIAGASRTVGPILLQYPFYAGIMALMTNTALVGVISGWFLAIANEATLPFWAFLAAGVLNFFIPSGGGQWAVQGPIFVQAAQTLEVPLPAIVMAIAYGDQWTNLIQPFWTLPLLAIAGLNMRSIMGYCFLSFLLTGLLFGGTLLALGAGA